MIYGGNMLSETMSRAEILDTVIEHQFPKPEVVTPEPILASFVYRNIYGHDMRTCYLTDPNEVPLTFSDYQIDGPPLRIEDQLGELAHAPQAIALKEISKIGATGLVDLSPPGMEEIRDVRYSSAYEYQEDEKGHVTVKFLQFHHEVVPKGQVLDDLSHYGMFGKLQVGWSGIERETVTVVHWIPGRGPLIESAPGGEELEKELARAKKIIDLNNPEKKTRAKKAVDAHFEGIDDQIRMFLSQRRVLVPQKVSNDEFIQYYSLV